MTKIAISGAAGRMGLRLIALTAADEGLQLAGAIESEGHDQLGNDAGIAAGVGSLGVCFSTQTSDDAEVMIDFSTPEAAEKIIDWCLQRNVPLVMATTGLSPDTEQKLRDCSRTLPIVWAPNMSLAVNLTMKLTEIASRALRDHASGVDVEIIETHHRFKADSPSGTALKFGKIAADAMGITEHQHGREGMVGQRPRNEIGYHAVRAGDDPGQHTILFGMLGEKIELRVAASNRDCYAAGALEAAKFLMNKAPGLYSMYDVLGLES